MRKQEGFSGRKCVGMGNMHCNSGCIKSSGKRTLAVILAASFLLSFSASCKKKKTSKKEQKKVQEYVSGKVISETDTYYNAQISSLKIPTDEGRTVNQTYILDCKYVDGIAVVRYEIDYEIPEDVDQLLMTREDQQEYYTTKIAIFDGEGNFIRELQTECLDISSIALDNDGNICIFGFYEDEMSENAPCIEVYSKEGEKKEMIPLLGKKYYMSNPTEMTLSVLPDGRYCISYLQDIILYKTNGEPSRSINDGDRFLGSTVISQNGKNYVLSRAKINTNDPDIRIREVDIKTGELGETIDASYLANVDEIISTTDGLYTIFNSGLYEVDFLSGELLKVFDWNDTDVSRDITSYTQFSFRNEEEIFAVHMGFNLNEDPWKLIHLTRAEKNPHAGKKEILVSGYWMMINSEFLSFISEYNKDPKSTSRVILYEYEDDFLRGEELTDLMNRVYRETLSGKGPDILVDFALESAFQTDQLMEDINTYLDGPNGIDRSKYFDNVLRAFETDGKLYHMPVNFFLKGVAVNTDYISNTGGWTYEEFEEAASKVGKKVDYFEGIERGELLMELLDSSLTDYVDYKNKTVDFQKDAMKENLRFAEEFGTRRIPKDEGYEEIEMRDGTIAYGEDYTETKFLSGQLACRRYDIGSIADAACLREKMDGKVSFLGFPSPSGSGMTIECNLSLGIVKSSQHKDLAWDFIRAYLEYITASEKSNRCFSVNREVFEKKSREEIEALKFEYEFYLKLGIDPEELKEEYVIPSESDISTIRELIEHAEKARTWDLSMYYIITEETAGYFKGDMTEDEAIKAIEKRAKERLKDL